MTSKTTFRIGQCVSAGRGDDYDTGTVIEATGDDADHPMNDGRAVFVAWCSGVRTWTPIIGLHAVDD